MFYDSNMYSAPLSMLQLPPAAQLEVNQKLSQPDNTIARFSQDGKSVSDLRGVVSEADFQQAVEIESEVGFVCKKCQTVFPAEVLCVNHQRLACFSKHPNDTKAVLKLIQTHVECLVCREKFGTVLDFKFHCDMDRHIKRVQKLKKTAKLQSNSQQHMHHNHLQQQIQLKQQQIHNLQQQQLQVLKHKQSRKTQEHRQQQNQNQQNQIQQNQIQQNQIQQNQLAQNQLAQNQLQQNQIQQNQLQQNQLQQSQLHQNQLQQSQLQQNQLQQNQLQQNQQNQHQSNQHQNQHQSNQHQSQHQSNQHQNHMQAHFGMLRQPTSAADMLTELANAETASHMSAISRTIANQAANSSQQMNNGDAMTSNSALQLFANLQRQQEFRNELESTLNRLNALEGVALSKAMDGTIESMAEHLSAVACKAAAVGLCFTGDNKRL